MHFYSFIFWNESDHKKYGFVLVLYLFRDISYFKLENDDNIKLSSKGLLLAVLLNAWFEVFKL